jgi:hypothetical protein
MAPVLGKLDGSAMIVAADAGHAHKALRKTQMKRFIAIAERNAPCPPQRDPNSALA